ncbi:unnamed protein product, partial [Ectocarpus sp. 13 AM-2016]
GARRLFEGVESREKRAALPETARGRSRSLFTPCSCFGRKIEPSTHFVFLICLLCRGEIQRRECSGFRMSAVGTEVAPRQESLPTKKPRHPVVDFLLAGSATSCASVLSNPGDWRNSMRAFHHSKAKAGLVGTWHSFGQLSNRLQHTPTPRTVRLSDHIQEPMDVVKTRMQLQSELVLRKACQSRQTTQVYRAPYKNALHAFYKICRDEGVRGIQAGLLPGLMYQILMNGTRLSLFAPVQKVLGVDVENKGKIGFFFRNLAAGAACGAAGALIGSPVFLVKARLQSQSKTHSLRTAGGGEFRWGLRGLTRGTSASVMRVMVGSATQLSVYSSCKAAVLGTGLFEDNVYAYLASSSVAGLVVTTTMNPLDVVSTRLYAQGTGVAERYTGPLDCAVKTVSAEGFRGVS